MKKVIKFKGKIVTAYELGSASEPLLRMIAEGRIRILDNGRYEIFSLESVNGSGEIACAGDFVKVDSRGYPYPNSRSFFIANHRHLQGDQYEQTPRLLDAWTVEDGMCSEIAYLMEHMGLVLDETSTDKYFTAPLWGTTESAPRDAVIVFYELTRSADGSISNASFNFVDREEFNRAYEWVE